MENSKVQDMQSRIVALETMLKRIATKESDIVKPLMEKVRASIQK
jgi:outer membrane protein